MMQTQQSGENKKILIINYEYPPLGGGGGIATRNFAEELAKSHKVVVLTTHFRGLKFHENINNIEIFRIPVLFRQSKSRASMLSLLTWPFLSIWQGFWLCKKFKFDIINTHFIFPTGITGHVLSKIFKVKNVLYVHGADIYDPERLNLTPSGNGFFSKLLKDITRIFLSECKAIACQSNDIKQRILNLFPELEQKITVIPLPFHKPDIDIPSGPSENYVVNTIKLISIGRLVKRKGYNYLFEALSLLPKYIGFELILIGDGPLRNDLVVQAKNLDILDSIKFKGFVTEQEKYSLLCNADAYILSSLHEGMGIVLQEAMYVGLPIIATNVGGQNDLLEDGVNAIKVDPADAIQLKEAILKLHSDKALSRKLGSNNKLKIQNYFSNIVGKYFEQYLLHLINND